jgi:hypothetical protein
VASLLKNEIEITSTVFFSVASSLKTEVMSIVFLSVASSLKNEIEIWGFNPKP